MKSEDERNIRGRPMSLDKMDEVCMSRNLGYFK